MQNNIYEDIIKKMADGGIQSPRLEARLLIGFVLKIDPNDAPLIKSISIKEKEELDDFINKRLCGMPLDKILGQKKILLENVVKDKSYFSILWTPADTYKIKSSFLSFYTFNFKLIGTLIIKIDEYNWFTTFCNDMNNCKDFKKEYLNNINIVEKIIKKCNNMNDGDNLERKLLSHDYKRFIYNY